MYPLYEPNGKSWQMRDFLIDTDIGSNIDDLLALALALEFDSIAIKGITIVGTGAVKRQQLVQTLLNAADMRGIPVAAGQQHPITPEVSLGFRSFQGHGIDLASHNDLVAPSAIELILSLAVSSTRLTIVALGPLTNLAMALNEEPEGLKCVNHVVIMGGSVCLSPLQLQFSDYNLASDPEAVRLVLCSGLPITLVPLQSCDAIRLDAEWIADLQTRSDRLGYVLSEAAKDYLERTGSGTARLCDVVAMAIALSPHLGITRPLEMIGVATDDKDSLDQIVSANKRGPCVRVVTDVDKQKLADLVHVTLLRSTLNQSGYGTRK